MIYVFITITKLYLRIRDNVKHKLLLITTDYSDYTSSQENGAANPRTRNVRVILFILFRPPSGRHIMA